MPTQKRSQSWGLLTADLRGVKEAVLDDLALLRETVAHCLTAVGAHPIRWVGHEFEPQGVSLVGHGSNVRVALHTWPELGWATIDLWAAGPDAQLALDLCCAALTGGGSRRRASSLVASAVSPPGE